MLPGSNRVGLDGVRQSLQVGLDFSRTKCENFKTVSLTEISKKISITYVVHVWCDDELNATKKMRMTFPSTEKTTRC